MLSKFKLVEIQTIQNTNNPTGIAYDLEVEDDHSYNVNGIVVHNSACSTKNVTGVTVPQFSAILDCAYEANRVNGKRPLIVADGGISEIGDIAKALGAGADLVMCGRMFASCREAPGERINGKKVYRGMASRDAMLTIRSSSSLPTAEGISTLIDASEQSAIDVIKHIKGGLQSSFSYSNATTLQEFRANVKFGVRHTAMKQ